jgi:DNA end-binding protein Ku
MQSMWAGTLAFGLVDIPVRLAPATRPRELAFRQVHAEDGGRITFRRSCTACGADVPYAEVAKAYQQADGALVALTDDDLASLPLEVGHRIELQCFVAPGTIDPLLVSRSYFLAPDGPAPGGLPSSGGPLADGGRPYTLFQAALARSGRVAVAQITLRQREARAALWARGQALVLQTLLAPDELTDPAGHTGTGSPAPDNGGPDADLSLAADLITAMAGEFDPAAHHDRYRDQLEDLIHRKATGRPADPRQIPNHTSHSGPTDLTELLRASLAAVPTTR